MPFVNDNAAQVSQSQDVESIAEEPQKNVSDTSGIQLRDAARQVLAAQFECYLKIIHDPLQMGEGDET